MKPLALVLTLLGLSLGVTAQKTGDAIQRQIKSLGAEKQIELSNDGGASKVFGRADNFADAEARAAHIEAMNFGMAFFFPGTSLTTAPDTINLTFWVLTKKPQFAANSKWVVTLPNETLDLGDSRYSGKGQMEYLNFKIKRDDLAKIAAGRDVKFKLGTATFTFTPEQLQLFRNIIAISEPK
jgi:hypothetical protein